MAAAAAARALLSRRDALRAGVVSCAAAIVPGPGRAQASPHRFKVGAAEVTVLSDGSMSAPLGVILPGRGQAEVAAVYAAAGRTLGEINLEVNVALVRLGAELILIDAGAGPDFAPARGKLQNSLAAAGVDAQSITRVVLTHAHPDHLWGVIDPLDGGSAFTKARHVISAAERDYWLRPGMESTLPEAARGPALGTQRRLKELSDRLETVRPGAEIIPGLAVLDTSGHTPGHISVLLRSGSDQLVIGGDALTEPVVSFARPEWRWGVDVDADQGIATRRRLLDMLATEKAPLLGYHLPWPGLGRIERSGSAYRFVQS